MNKNAMKTLLLLFIVALMHLVLQYLNMLIVDDKTLYNIIENGLIVIYVSCMVYLIKGIK